MVTGKSSCQAPPPPATTKGLVQAGKDGTQKDRSETEKWYRREGGRAKRARPQIYH